MEMPRCNCRFDSDETDSMDVYEMTTRRNQWGQSHHDYRKNATHTVDGRNPLVDVGSLSPLFTRFYTSQRISSVNRTSWTITLLHHVAKCCRSFDWISFRWCKLIDLSARMDILIQYIPLWFPDPYAHPKSIRPLKLHQKGVFFWIYCLAPEKVAAKHKNDHAD